MQRLLRVLFLVALLALLRTDATVISSICGDGKILSLADNATIIRFSSDGFPSKPYGSSCSATFNLTFPAFFVFEHINLAVEDSIELSGLGGETATLSGSAWTWNSGFFYPSTQFDAPGVATFKLNVLSTFKTAGFRMWVYPYSDPFPLCDDEQICGESQMFFSPGFPYDHSSVFDGAVGQMEVNSNAYRWSISSAAVGESDLTVNGDDVRDALDGKVNVSQPFVSGQSCESGQNGFSPMNLTVAYNRSADSSQFFVLAVQSNSDAEAASSTVTVTLKDDLQMQSLLTNDRGTLYPNCFTQDTTLALDPTLNGADFSIGVWMMYFDSEGADNVQISLLPGFSIPTIVQGILHGNSAHGPVTDPNGKRYQDSLFPFQDTRFLSYAGNGWHFEFTSDAMLSGAGGEFKAFAFPKNSKPQTIIVKGNDVQKVVTPGYPYGYATSATANYTFIGAKDQLLKLCLTDFGQTFSGFDTTQAKLDIYEGLEPLNEKFLHSFEHESDTKSGCVYTEQIGEPMLVRFTVPGTFNISMNVSLPGLGPIPLQMPVPLILGGRIIPTLDLQKPGNSLGFSFNVANARFEDFPKIVAGTSVSLTISFFLLSVISHFVWIP